MDLIWLSASLILLLMGIVFACTVFTNAIEWVGKHMDLSEGAVGSVFAAVGTALPETIVPIVAIVGGVLANTPEALAEGEHIGIGAILGAPFLLSTLAMGITAAAVFYYAGRQKRSTTMKLDHRLFHRDLKYFFGAFATVVAAAYIPFPTIKWGLAVWLFVYYLIYVKRTLVIEQVTDPDEPDLEPLMFQPRSEDPAFAMMLVQTLVGLLMIIGFAHLFVERISELSHTLSLNPLVLSLIIVPIATEMPEKFNSVIWIGKQKDNLALGNITGAMVFQSCIPTAVGIAFTPWVLDAQAILSVIITLLSAGAMYVFAFRWGLEKTAHVLGIGGIFYIIFLVLIFFGLAPTQFDGAGDITAPIAPGSHH